MNLKETLKFISERDMTKNKDVKAVQTAINDLGYYEGRDTLKVDGIAGPRTLSQIRFITDLNEKLVQDSVFDAVERQQKQWYQKSRFHKNDPRGY